MSVRQNALYEWLTTNLGGVHFTLTSIAGDASFRRYFRLSCEQYSRIIMDAPPDKESMAPFIVRAKMLSKHGIHTPSIFIEDQTLGFALLEDLGDELFLKVVSQDNAHLLYTSAMDTLINIQKCPTDDLPSFDQQAILQELLLFPEWFIKQYLNLVLSQDEEEMLHQTFDWLTQEICQQPQVFMHRDYHSRNLIVVDPKTSFDLGVIDFQDAMKGPFTYDLVSLLKDCYIQWTPEQILNWSHYFYTHLPLTHDWSFSQFSSAFELCGLQRHLKVLGIFCRLHLRDSKPQYLHDLPLTFHYVLACLEHIKPLQPFYRFMQQRVYEPFNTIQKQMRAKRPDLEASQS